MSGKKRNWLNTFSPSILRMGINFWPPFLGSGIKVTKLTKDFRNVEVILKMHWFNRNYVGTHFGGSMFSMTDPFYMLMLIKNLGSNYIVWDKAASIQFKKPAKGKLTANFEFSEDEIIHIKQQADSNSKYVFDKSIDILNVGNEVVASVVKTLFVKRKEERIKDFR